MTSASTENIGVRRALQIDAEHISDFNIAMALETEGKPLDSETVGGGVRAREPGGVLRSLAGAFWVMRQLLHRGEDG